MIENEQQGLHCYKWGKLTRLLTIFNWLVAATGLVALTLADWPRAVAVISLVYLAILFILIAPFKLWEGQKARAEDAEERLRPKLDLSRTGVELYGDEKVAYVRVENKGKVRIKDACAELCEVALRTDNGFIRDHSKHSAFMLWSDRHGGGHKATFDKRADLQVVRFSGETQALIVVGMKDRALEKASAYRFLIRFSAENSPPREQEYVLEVTREPWAPEPQTGSLVWGQRPPPPEIRFRPIGGEFERG